MEIRASRYLQTFAFCFKLLYLVSVAAPSLATPLGGSTLTVVTATTCSVLGLLLLVMLAVLLQRRVHPALPAPPPPPPPYPPPPQRADSEHDRVALIQFADGVQVVLPSYEEAVRGRQPTRLMGSQRSSRAAGAEYRPLPSVPSSLRDRDHHRNSIVTTSSATRDNLSLAFGSMDTVNVSDGTSTSITIGTYDSGASNPSIATSQRVAAGSLNSSNGSLANEGK